MALVATHISSLLKRGVNQGNCTLLATKIKNVACYVTSTSSNLKEKWDLVSAVCLERKQIISKEKNEIEKQYSALLTQIEFEKSFLSDNELRHIRDKAQAELIKNGEFNESDAGLDLTISQTAQDFEDSCQEEFNKFVFATRTTDADKNKDCRSLKRKLDKNLLLLIEQELGDKNYVWALPQGVRDEGETMRQAAERVLKETCGSQLKVQFMGNAPCGFYKYKYPKHLREVAESPIGVKVFFFKAVHLTGQVEKHKSKVKDYKWLVKEELGASIPREYYNSVSQFLIDE